MYSFHYCFKKKLKIQQTNLKHPTILKKHKKQKYSDTSFVLLGINAAGLASKLDSFDYALKSVKAKIFFVQEVKQQHIGNIKTEYLKGFQLF